MQLHEQAVLLVAWIQFLNACFWEGHIFGKIGYIMETELADWIYKPTIGCPICMTPWHGLLAWLIFGISPWAILLAAGMNVVIIRWTPDDQKND